MTVGQRIGLWLGLVGATALFIAAEMAMNWPAAPLPGAFRVAACTWLMACWWLSECVPLAATSLLPLVLFPFLGIEGYQGVSIAYSNPFVLLLMGGFFIALALERWGVHRRIALNVIVRVGTAPDRLILAFLIVTAGLSMWISNTATTLIMLPIATAVLARLEVDRPGDPRLRPLAAGLLLGVAYAASIGGLGTPVGTAPNLIFMAQYQKAYPDAAPLTFFHWMRFAIPIVVIMIAGTWWILTRPLRKFAHLDGSERGLVDVAHLRAQRDHLGQMLLPEKLVLAAFGLASMLWIFRQSIEIGSITIPGWANLLGVGPRVDDSTVAILVALLLFFVRVHGRPEGAAAPGNFPLLDWETAQKIPWGLLLLFGGGLAVADGFQRTGLSAWVGDSLGGVASWPTWMLVATISVLVTFLSEVTSNTATTTILMPVLAAVAKSHDLDPLMVMLPATLAGSLGFMMPAGTPPNAIVFATGRFSIAEMARNGFWVNCFGSVVVTVCVLLFV